MGYIYKTTNIINGKIYVGKSRHNSDTTKSYLGSGIIINNAIKKYGKDNFAKEIIENDVSNGTLNERETYWISKLNSNDKNIGYNLTIGGDGGDTHTLNPRIEQIKEERSGRGNPFYGKHHSEETKKILSQKAKGKIVTKETRQKISKTLTFKYKNGIIKKTTSDRARKLQSEMMKKNNPQKRKDVREKMSKIMLTEKNNSIKWWIFENINGQKIERFSFRRTCKELGLSYGTMRKWIGRKDFNREGWTVYERNKE